MSEPFSKADFEAIDVTRLIEREGFACLECGHRHAGLTLAYICVGCPCPRTMPPESARTVDAGGKP